VVEQFWDKGPRYCQDNWIKQLSASQTKLLAVTQARLWDVVAPLSQGSFNGEGSQPAFIDGAVVKVEMELAKHPRSGTAIGDHLHREFGIGTTGGDLFAKGRLIPLPDRSTKKDVDRAIIPQA